MSLTGEGGQTAEHDSTGDASCRRPCAQTQVARAGRPRDRVDDARARHHGRRIWRPEHRHCRSHRDPAAVRRLSRARTVHPGTAPPGLHGPRQGARPHRAGLHDPGLSRSGRHREQRSVRARLPDRRRFTYRHGERRALPKVAAGCGRRRARDLSRRARPRRLAGRLPPDRAVLHWRRVAVVRLDHPQARPAPAAVDRRHAGGQPAGLRAPRLA